MPCFMFTASRLGRRPKRLKDPNEPKHHSSGSQPIAPYPSPSELHKLRMAELQRLLQQNGTFKAELMQAFLCAAQASFREHQRNPTSPTSENAEPKIKTKDIKGENESGYSSLSSPSSMKSQSPQTDLNNETAENQGEGRMMPSPPDTNTESVDIKNVNSFLLNSGFLLNQNMFNTSASSSEPGSKNNFVQVKPEPGTDFKASCHMNPSSSPNVDMLSFVNSLHHEEASGDSMNFINTLAALQQQQQQQQQQHGALSDSTAAMLANGLVSMEQQNSPMDMSNTTATSLINSIAMLQQQQPIDENSASVLINTIAMLQQQQQQSQVEHTSTDALSDIGQLPQQQSMANDPSSPTASLVSSFAALHQQHSIDNSDTQSQMEMYPPSNMSMSSLPSVQEESPKEEDNQLEVKTEDFTPEQVTSIFLEASQPVPDTRMVLINQVTESVVDAHLDTCRPTHDNVRKANEEYAIKSSMGLMVSSM